MQHLGTAMYSVQGLDQDTVNKVLDEFLAIIKEQTSLGLGAGNYIRNVMTRALGEDKAESVLSRITPSSTERPIEILDWMDARSIAELIIDEHPQIIALVISYLDFGLGADVLGQLPEEQQADVIARIATLQTVQPEALRELETVMQRKFKANTSLRASQVGGVNAAAKIMNFTKQAMEARIMNALKDDDEDLMIAIQESMFVFDNLVMSDDKSLQTLLRSVDTEDLVLALKGADEPLRDKLFSCMSSRAAANLQDEMEALWPGPLDRGSGSAEADHQCGAPMSMKVRFLLAAVVMISSNHGERLRDVIGQRTSGQAARGARRRYPRECSVGQA